MSAVSDFTLHVRLHWKCWPNPTGEVICLLMCGRWGSEVSEMKMTRLYLIVVSICGLRQDVCLNVYLSVCPYVSLLSWCHVLCLRVKTPWLQSAIMGNDLIQQEISLDQIASLSQQALALKICIYVPMQNDSFKHTTRQLIRVSLELLCTITCGSLYM